MTIEILRCPNCYKRSYMVASAKGIIYCVECGYFYDVPGMSKKNGKANNDKLNSMSNMRVQDKR